MSTDTTPDVAPKSLDEGTPEGTSGKEDRDPSRFLVGRVLSGKYRIDGVLGRGGMGVVHAGCQLELDRSVAIKFLRHGPGQGARTAQRFAREARAIAKMQSEHVVRVFDAGVEDGLSFIVMERLVGHDLAAELARGRLSAETTAGYLLQACEAIAEAHSLGIVHRDLKPSNLFIAETVGGRRLLKVLDFGVSKWLGPAPDFDTPLATGTHSFIGTPAYVSPEQLTHPDTVDERTDVWALGVVLYQCLCGVLPFEADSVPRLCAAILTAEPRALAEFDAAPGALRDIVLRCLKKAPADRYSNVAELAFALADFAPPAARQPLEWLERLSKRPNASDADVDRVSVAEQATTPQAVTPQAVTPSNQSTTAGFSQDTQQPDELLRTRARPRALRRRRTVWAILAGGTLVGLAVAAILSRGTEPTAPVESREAIEAARGEPTNEPAASPVRDAVRPNGTAEPSISQTKALPTGAASASGSKSTPKSRIRAPGPAGSVSFTPPPSSAPSASSSTPHALPAPPSSAAPPVNTSSDDFDRNIYRR